MANRVLAEDSIEGITLVDLVRSTPKSTQLREKAEEAFGYLKEADDEYELVLNGIDFIALSRFKTKLVPVPRGLVISKSSSMLTNSFHLALSLIWAAKSIELDRRGTTEDELKRECVAAQLRFVKRFPESEDWVKHVQQAAGVEC